MANEKILRILDGFSGTGNWANCWRNNTTYNVCIDSVDIFKTGEHINYVCDMRNFAMPLLNEYHIIYLSPPCNKFSKMNPNPSKEEFDKAKELSDLSFRLAKQAKLCYIIENPQTGAMPKLYPEEKYTIVDYSEYGFPMRKRTAIWSNMNLQSDLKTQTEIKYNKYPISYLGKKERAAIPPKLATRIKNIILKRYHNELQEFKIQK